VSRRPALLLDRDGVLIRELDHPVREPSQLELSPGAATALARAKQLGYALVVVTNQSAIARGWLRFEELDQVHHALQAQLTAAGAALDAIYLCPHHPSAGYAPYRRACACRKPGSRLVERALRERALDPERSWMIGDAVRDLEAADRAGVRPILVATGKGAREAAKLVGSLAERTQHAPDLAGAVALALERDGHGR